MLFRSDKEGQKDVDEVPEETLEELRKAAWKRSGKKKTARNYDMPPGEAEIWGDDEEES